METLNQALARAAEHPECGLRLLDRQERASWLGWEEIYDRATRLAGGLRAMRIERGEPVGLILPTGRDFFEAFFGVLLAGAVPVPLYPPVRLGRFDEYRHRTARMLRSAGIGRLLTDRRLQRILGEVLRDAACQGHTVDEVPTAVALACQVDPDDLGVVQFSSGTTVDPKPVALTHRALLAQTVALNSFWPDDEEVRHSGVSWLPLYHDMGLIGCVFTVLERPSTLTLIPPELFVARPAVWLRSLSRYRATISPAPTFAYGLCTEKIRDEELAGVDLSAWRVALCGAETVVPSVLERFSARFAPWGFRPEALTPVYGLSEAALAVTFADLDRPFRRRTVAQNGRVVVSVGRPLPGFEVEIRDAAGVEVSPPEEGRIWVRGPSLMREYLNQPVATAAVFANGWLDTGDIGFLAEGELHVSGRAKDLLIVRGANHAPDDIEATVSDITAVRTGCVAAVAHLPAESDSEQVWLFVERRRVAGRGGDAAIAQACRQKVLAETGIALDRVEVLEPGTLPRTSSGKIRRRRALELFLAGALEPPRRVTTAHLLRTMGRSFWAQLRKRQEHDAS